MEKKEQLLTMTIASSRIVTGSMAKWMYDELYGRFEDSQKIIVDECYQKALKKISRTYDDITNETERKFNLTSLIERVEGGAE